MKRQTQPNNKESMQDDNDDDFVASDSDSGRHSKRPRKHGPGSGTHRNTIHDDAILEWVARTFANLLRTATMQLGISVHSLTRDALAWVAEYFQKTTITTRRHHHRDDEEDGEPPQPSSSVSDDFMTRIVIARYLCAGLAAMLKDDPEIAMAPLRQYGRRIWTTIQQQLARYPKHTSTALPEELCEYLLQHLYV
jgi:hypothetical protein